MAHLITQQDADFFFEMEKFPEDDMEYQFPLSGEKLILSFTSADKHEKFLFDLYRGSIKITKGSIKIELEKHIF